MRQLEDALFLNWTPKSESHLNIFLRCLPLNWLKDVLLKETTAVIEADRKNALLCGKLLQFIGLRLLMARCIGWTKQELFAQTNHCPYRLGDYMSQRRFDLITRELRFTASPVQAIADKFWQVRDMIAAFNSNMKAVFSSSWVICLDESMSIWTQRWTCPGWIYCPRKPHPIGNEYHTACCAKSGILFSMELVEGKDAPPHRQLAYDNLAGKTTGLLLWMLEQYFHTGKYVVLDSGYCV
jgi:hypothetical protein